MRLRKIEISNFRGIRKLDWVPNAGINCFVGPGDSGKSTVLDAIDWCLGARRSLPVTDADFHMLNVDDPILIDITIGKLNDKLKGLDGYGLYLRGFKKEDGSIEDEPSEDLETVLTARLEIGDDLEPHWSLVSERAEAQDTSRFFSWGDRVEIAPIRIGAYASHHLSWQKGSILTRVSDEEADTSAALATAARHARQAFGESTGDQLDATLRIIESAADDLGIGYGEEIRALLDAQSISFSGGTISLHDANGVPLKKLGLGSSRLLVAGLQKHVAQESSISLVDELEYGLEPHRITRLLSTLGAKNKDEPVQVFLTTHSPVVLRELSGDQLHIVRGDDAKHVVTNVGSDDAMQGTLRKSAEAFLGVNVIVCEGATEVGLIRGIDLYRGDQGRKTLMASGGVTVDAGGVSKIYRSACSFQKLGYNVSVLRDDDKKPDKNDESFFEMLDGKVFKWTDGFAIEDEIVDCVSDEAVLRLFNYAAKEHGDELVHAHLETVLKEAVDVGDWIRDITEEKRKAIAAAAKQGSWFKRISIMEGAAREVIGPDLADAHEDFSGVIEEIFKWAGAGDG